MKLQSDHGQNVPDERPRALERPGLRLVNERAPAVQGRSGRGQHGRSLRSLDEESGRVA
jgi:hypothetical protein